MVLLRVRTRGGATVLSAALSVMPHAAQRRRIRTDAYALIFLLRLRRRALMRRAYVEFSSDQMSIYSTR
eukprot:3901642-Prymnesium_polylepis.1